jgi:hypothetical protein
MLADLQRELQETVRGTGTSAPASTRLRLDSADGLSVYQNAYRARLTEALRNQYPRLARHVGAEPFAGIANDYIAAHPSCHRSLRDFGGDLSAHLAASPTLADAHRLAELAAFEWSLGLSFDAPAGIPCDIDTVANIPPADWPALRFGCVPHLTRLTLEPATVALWQALGEPVETRNSETPANDHGAPTVWVTYRHELTPRYRSLSPEEAAAFTALADGQPFATVCEVLVSSVRQEAASRAATYLKSWLSLGWLEAL